MTPDARTNDTKAGTHEVPAFVVPADPNPTGGAAVLLQLIRDLQAENTRLRQEADRLYLLAFAPADRRDMLLDRLDQAHEAMAEWATVDGALDAAWQAYLDGLDGIRPPVPLHPEQTRRAA